MGAGRGDVASLQAQSSATAAHDQDDKRDGGTAVNAADSLGRAPEAPRKRALPWR